MTPLMASHIKEAGAMGWLGRDWRLKPCEGAGREGTAAPAYLLNREGAVEHLLNGNS